MTYIDEIFKLCSMISKHEVSKELQDQINKMYSKEPSFSSQSILLQSVRYESDFYGILVVNNEIEKDETDNLLLKSVEPLNQNDKQIFIIVHNIMSYYFYECIKGLEKLPENLKKALNPYYNYKVDISEELHIDLSKYLDKNMFNDLIDKFRDIKSVKLFNKEIRKFYPFLKSMKTDDLFIMLESIKNEITDSGFSNIPKTLQEVERRVYSGNLDNQTDLLRFFFLCYSIKETLMISMDTIAMALKGKEMGVIDEDSIITIKSEFSNLFKNGMEFLLQPSEKPNPSVGNLCVIDYTTDNQRKKEFAYCVATTYRMKSEFGETIECKLNIVNEDLNQYTYLDSLYEK